MDMTMFEWPTKAKVESTDYVAICDADGNEKKIAVDDLKNIQKAETTGLCRIFGRILPGSGRMVWRNGCIRTDHKKRNNSAVCRFYGGRENSDGILQHTERSLQNIYAQRRDGEPSGRIYMDHRNRNCGSEPDFRGNMGKIRQRENTDRRR